jgi:serine/threonine protein kinase
MTYMLLSSQIPFVGRDMTDIAREIMRGRYSFSGRKWHGISKEGKDFIDCLLLRDPKKRLNADQGESTDCVVARFTMFYQTT